MESKELTDISISEVIKKYNFSHIDNDLILFDDLSSLPIPYHPCRNVGIIVALCTKGEYSYSADTQEYVVHQGDAMIIHDGRVINNHASSPDLQGIGIMMSYDFFQEIVKGVHEMSSLFLFSRIHPVFALSTAEAQNVINYFRLIKQKVDDMSNHFRKDVVRSLISTMIYDLCNVIYRIQQNSNQKRTRAEAIFTSFIKLVEQNYRHERRVAWYGQQLCITSKYLSETVKQVSRRTPNEWIDNYVIMELRVQLKNTPKSIKEISHELNFPNQSFMGKFFKEHVGMSPLAYRKS